jgi:hypothetical protein
MGRNGFATLRESGEIHSQLKAKAETDCSRKRGTAVEDAAKNCGSSQ